MNTSLHVYIYISLIPTECMYMYIQDRMFGCTQFQLNTGSDWKLKCCFKILKCGAEMCLSAHDRVNTRRVPLGACITLFLNKDSYYYTVWIIGCR